MKFESTAPITGATVYRIKWPLSVTMFGPKDLAGFMLEPVNSPKKNEITETINPTPKDSVNKLDSLRTKTWMEYIRSKVIIISIPQVCGIDTEGEVAPSTTIIAAHQAPRH